MNIDPRLHLPPSLIPAKPTTSSTPVILQEQDAIISIRDVSKSYGQVQALKGISLDVKKGSILGLLGPNGAGKTTLVRILTTLLVPDSGQVFIAGIDAVARPAQVRNHIGLAGQYAAVDENLTGLENLVLVGKLYHLPAASARSRAAQLLGQFALLEAGNRTVKTYSGGMRRRLDLAASLVGQPQILFLDEPTTGLDPRSRSELWDIIEQLVREGTTILLTTQYLEEADYLADKIVMVDHGSIVASGTAAELKARVGLGVLALHVADKTRLAQARQLLLSAGHDPVHEDEISHALSITAVQGPQTLIAVVKLLDAAGIEIADIELRHPTLDEVFLALTAKV